MDLSGIDNHTVSTLRITNVGSTVRTTIGDVILIMNQYAHMPDGKTIHSCVQMEHFGVKVNDKSPIIAGKDYVPGLVTPDGAGILAEVRNGLLYTEGRPYTNHEWDTLPHIHLTSNEEWDPTQADYSVDEDDYHNTPRHPSSVDDSLFDIHGEIKDEYLRQEAVRPDTFDEEDMNPSPQKPEGGKATGQREIRAYFHSLVRDEIEEDVMRFEAEGVYTELPTRELYPTLRRSRRTQEGQKPDYSLTKRRSKSKGRTKRTTKGSTHKEGHMRTDRAKEVDYGSCTHRCRRARREGRTYTAHSMQ